MREVKDSGIEWIGEMPDDWRLTKLKYIVQYPLQYGANESGIDYSDELPRYIRITDITMDNKLKEEGKLSLEEDTAKPYLLYDNDILFSRSGASVGKTFIYRIQYGKAAFAGYLIRAIINSNKVIPDFVYYNTLGHNYEAWKQRIFVQSTIQNIGADKFNNYIFAYPTISKQQAIVKFLDGKCAKIDKILSKTRASIEEYKKLKQAVITQAVTKGLYHNAEMKDSGIEWIGQIPNTWEISKLKHHLRRNEPRNPGNVIVLSLYRELGVIPKDSRNDNYNVTSEDTSNYKYVKPGDFVVNKMKAWQGSVAVSEYEGIVSPAYFVYQFTDDVYLKKYFHYLIRGCYKDEFRRLSGGIRIGQWDLSSDALDNILIITPTISEQQEIADYLDKKCTEIDNLITKKENCLAEIENYKKSLIYEYVTGKKEVPETWA